MIDQRSENTFCAMKCVFFIHARKTFQGEKNIIHPKCYKVFLVLLLRELLDERKRAMVLDPGRMNPFVSPDEHSKATIFNSVTLDTLLNSPDLVSTSENWTS